MNYTNGFIPDENDPLRVFLRRDTVVRDDAYFQRKMELDGNMKHLSRRAIVEGKEYKLSGSMMIPVKFKNRDREKQFVRIIGLEAKHYDVIGIDDDDNQRLKVYDAPCFVLLGDLKQAGEFKIYTAIRDVGKWDNAHETTMHGIRKGEQK